MNTKPLVALLLAALPLAARAQGVAYVIPSIALGEVWDSNVFSSATSPESDVILRTSPAVQAGYRSDTLTLGARYSFDAEQYRDHPVLNDAIARQQADANLRYSAGRIATFTTTGSFFSTHLPQEFNLLTGLNVQRAPATQFTVAPLLALDLTARTRASVGFDFERSAFTLSPDVTTAGVSPSIATRTLTIGLDRKFSSTNTLRAQFREEGFDFGDTAPAASGTAATSTGTARVMLGGWTHEFSPLTRATIMAGPRFSDGGVRPEISADVRRRLKSGDLAVSFSRTETVALGEAGTIEVERLTGSVTVRPARHLELRAGPAVSRDVAHVSGLNATVYLVDAAATSPLTRWLSIEATYQNAWERGDVPQVGPLVFAHRVFMIRAIATAPRPSGAPAGPARAVGSRGL